MSATNGMKSVFTPAPAGDHVGQIPPGDYSTFYQPESAWRSQTHRAAPSVAGPEKAAAFDAAVQTVVRQSQSMEQFYLAFLAAQDAVVNPKKNKSVQTDKYRFKFADLGAVLKIVRPALVDAGIVLMQIPMQERDKMILLTRLIHAASGQWMEVEMPIVAGASPQEFGSKITYMRRYALTSIMGIVSDDEDDDGGRASGRPSQVTDIAPTGPASKMPDIADGFGETVLRQLARQLKGAADFDDIVYAMRYWTDHIHDIQRVARAADARTYIEDLIGITIGRLGSPILGRWLAMSIRARDAKQWSTLGSYVDGKWAAELARARETVPALFSVIQALVEAERLRIHPPQKQAAVAEPEPSPAERGAEASMPPDEEIIPQPEEMRVQSFMAPLLDAFGDKVNDAWFTSPVQFVRAYIELRDAVPADQHTALAEMNEGALAAAALAAKPAADLLADVSAADLTHGEWLVRPPMGENGQIMLGAYLAAVTEAVERLGPATIDRWKVANQSVLDELPQPIRIRALKRVADRRQALGLKPLGDE